MKELQTTSLRIIGPAGSFFLSEVLIFRMEKMLDVEH